MAKDDTLQLLEQAKEYYKDKYVVAFLGKKGTGKTIVSALLKDALFNFFIPKNADKFNGRVVKGFKEINQIQSYFLKGEFPPESPTQNPTEIRIELTNTATLGRTIELLLQDISGEDHSRILLQDKNGRELVRDILHEAQQNQNTFGPASYIIFAKLYVILIDCEKFENWQLEIANDLSHLLNSLLLIKKEINETTDNKIVNPIAVILTKTDTLNKEIKETPKDLVKNHMKEIYFSTLPAVLKGDSEYFGVHIDTRKPNQTEIKAYKKEQEEKIAKAKQTALLELKDLKDRAEEVAVETVVANAVEEAKTKAQAEGKQGPDLENIIATAEAVARKEAEVEFELSYEAPPLKKELSLEDKEKELKWKVKIPFSYTSGEYMKLISWIIEVLT